MLIVPFPLNYNKNRIYNKITYCFVVNCILFNFIKLKMYDKIGDLNKLYSKQGYTIRIINNLKFIRYF